MEELENKLCLKQGSGIILVRPGFGNQSESISGILSAFTAQFPITFQVTSESHNVIFTINDVVSIVEKDETTGQFVITLKKPEQYYNWYIYQRI